MPRKPWQLTAILAASAALGACGSLGGAGNSKPTPPVESGGAAQDTAALVPLLEMMSSLPQGDPARQAELFQSAKEAAELSPTTSNRLKFALALATPGHAGSNPVAAQRQLSELLARPETLLPVERLLATVALRQVELTLVLQAENKRMRDETPRDSHDKEQALNRRLSAEQDENAKLRKQLDEARAKLEAVTHIEQRPRTP